MTFKKPIPHYFFRNILQGFDLSRRTKTKIISPADKAYRLQSSGYVFGWGEGHIDAEIAVILNSTVVALCVRAGSRAYRCGNRGNFKQYGRGRN